MHAWVMAGLSAPHLLADTGVPLWVARQSRPHFWAPPSHWAEHSPQGPVYHSKVSTGWW